MIVLQALIVYVPFLNNFFATSAITVKDWLVLAAFIPTLFLLDELRKLIIRTVIKRKTLRSALIN